MFITEENLELKEKVKKDIEAAWKEHKAGKSIPLEEVMREYSL